MLLAFAPPALHAQVSGTPADVEAGIDRFIAPLVPLDVFSGVILVVRDTTTLHERAYGAAHVELGVPLRPDHVFRIASVSKPFTRILIGRLVDRGMIGLDSSIAPWLPRFPSARRITFRMLLDHRAGVPSVNSLPYDEEGIAPNTLARLVDSLARRPLDFEPGSARRYSNGGYAVLAALVERITGRPFGAVLHDEVIAPMGLRDTRHEEEGAVVPRLVTGYMPDPQVPGVLARAPFQQSATKTGGGSMVSTARDLARWAAAVGRSDVLRPSTWQELFPTADSAFAFTGRAPGFNAAVVHDRRRDVTAVVLANNYAAGMTYDIAAAALQLARGDTVVPLAVSAPSPISRAALDGAPGVYEPPSGWLGLPPGQTIEVRRSGDHLSVYVGDLPVDALVGQPGGSLLARSLWSLIDFSATDGRVTAMQVRPLYAEGTITMRRVR